MNEFQGRRAQGFVLDQNKNVHVGVKSRQQAARLEQLQQHHIAHAKPERGQGHFPAADELDEVVVAAAAGQRPEFALAVEGLKDDTRVVGQTADDAVIHPDKVAQSAGGEIVEDALQLSGGKPLFDERVDRCQGKTEGAEFLVALFGSLAFQLVHNLVERVFLCRVAAAALEEVVPGIPAAQADDEILRGQAKGAQGVDEQRDQFRIGGRIRFPEDIRIQLEMFPQAAFLLSFVAEQLGQGEPFNGLLIIALVRGNHAGQGGSHFRAQRDGASALVRKVVELPHNLLAALGGEEFQGLERRAVVLPERIAPGGRPPFFEDVLAGVRAPHIHMRQRFGIKVSKSGQSFHAGMVGKIWNEENSKSGFS